MILPRLAGGAINDWDVPHWDDLNSHKFIKRKETRTVFAPEELAAD